MFYRSPLEKALESVFQGWRSPDSVDEAALTPFSKKLIQIPGEHRNSFLMLLRRQTDSYPYRLVHPTWIIEIMPVDPLIRRWILGVIPPDVRTRFHAFLPFRDVSDPLLVDPIGPPQWFEGWWRLYLWKKCPYPLPIPGEGNHHVLEMLWRLDDRDLIRFCRVFGLRSFAEVIRTMSRDEVVRLVFQFEPELQEILKHWASKPPFDGGTFWQERYPSIIRHAKKETLIPLYMGLADIARVCRVSSLQDTGCRIMYRLPSSLGKTFRSFIDDDQLIINEEKIGDWEKACSSILKFLIEKGAISRPSPEASQI